MDGKAGWHPGKKYLPPVMATKVAPRQAAQ
jgi:hypothetical protein